MKSKWLFVKSGSAHSTAAQTSIMPPQAGSAGRLCMPEGSAPGLPSMPPRPPPAARRRREPAPASGAHPQPPGYAPPVRLEGIHHVTAITADAPANVDFYVRVLGLRLVKKTVNFDQPDVYHLYYGDEQGSPGWLLTFFEFPSAARGRHGAGMVHTLVWRVPDEAALEFWSARLEAEGVDASPGEGRVRLADPEGLGIELAVV